MNQKLGEPKFGLTNYATPQNSLDAIQNNMVYFQVSDHRELTQAL